MIAKIISYTFFVILKNRYSDDAMLGNNVEIPVDLDLLTERKMLNHKKYNPIILTVTYKRKTYFLTALFVSKIKKQVYARHATKEEIQSQISC